MDPQDRKFIDDNRHSWLESIDFNAVAPFLKQEKIFTCEMLDDIEKQSDDYSRKLKLLEDLPTRGPYAFEKFISVLLKADQQDALKCVTSISNVRTNFKNRIQDLNDNHKYIKNLVPDNRSIASTSIKNFKYQYEVNSKPRGLCFIINNVDYNGLSEYRYGSDVDAERLDEVFNQLGYKVSLKRDLSGFDMKRELYDFSKSLQFKEVDSCIVIILSHGSYGCILGTDMEKVHMSEITSLFNNENCKNLIGKPKLFFIQACRGDDYNGISVELSTDSNSVKSIEKKASSDKMPSEKRIVISSDIFLSFSTVENFVSIRDHHLGTWYCQAFCKCLKEFALTHDLSAILYRVDAEVQQFLGAGGEKQATEFRVIGVHKAFYFNIPEENKKYFNFNIPEENEYSKLIKKN